MTKPAPVVEQAQPEAVIKRVVGRNHEFRQSTYYEGRDRFASPTGLDARFLKKKKLRKSVFVKSKSPSGNQKTPDLAQSVNPVLDPPKGADTAASQFRAQLHNHA